MPFFKKYLTASQLTKKKSWITVDGKRVYKNVNYYNIPAAYDSEWTSVTIKENNQPLHLATLYMWMFGIGDAYDCPVAYGRQTSEFPEFINLLEKVAPISSDNRLVVYVHFLGADFSYIRRWFQWNEVMTDSPHNIFTARYHGFEFKCSLKLAGGRGLGTIGSQLTRHDIGKKTGDLNYDLVRHWKTPLTEKEMGYCEYDIRTLLAYIDEKIQEEKEVTKIPLTNTGYIRRHIKGEVMGNSNYVKAVHALKIADVYNLATSTFRGGDTHANPLIVRKLLKDVASYDLTSAYPAALVLNRFPMTTPSPVKPTNHIFETAKYDPSTYYMARIAFYNLRPLVDYQHPISASKTLPKHNPTAVLDNGRIVSAEYVEVFGTELDMHVISQYYTWDYYEVYEYVEGKKRPLPTPLVKAILEIYKRKTELKGVVGEEHEYLIAKNMMNSCYGMMATNPLRENYELDINDEEEPYHLIEKEALDELTKEDGRRGRFLYYLWGIWTTSYTRYELYKGITACGYDFVYADTDSTKLANYQKHMKQFEALNDEIQHKIVKAAEYHRLPKYLFSPRSKEGKEFPIGLWDFEGVYKRFKTLGAKRYIVEHDERWVQKHIDELIKEYGWPCPYELTCAGLKKTGGLKYLLEISPDDPISAFDFGLRVPEKYSGRTVHHYLNAEHRFKLVDYLGTEAECYEKSALHVSPTTFEMDEMTSFIQFIKLVQSKGAVYGGLN